MYIEIILYFLKLGVVGFGGPLALISQMQKDLVKKHWITEEEFNQTFALIKAMPGPIAFQMAVFMGQHRKKTLGGILAGIFIILPAFLMMILLAMSEQLPQFQSFTPFFRGMQVAALGVIAASLSPLIRENVKSKQFVSLSVLGFGATYIAPAYEPLIIICFGLAIVITKSRHYFMSLTPVLLLGLLPDSNILGQLFWYCFKAGAFVFGTGLAIIPMIENDFVNKTHWFTHNQFMNALALGQITPGPITITVTYLGFKTAGWWGAIATTLGIYGASGIHMLTWFPRAIKKLTNAEWMPHFMFGAIAAVAGSVAATLVRLSQNLNLDYLDLVIIVVSFVLVFKKYLATWVTIILFGVCYMLKSFL